MVFCGLAVVFSCASTQAEAGPTTVDLELVIAVDTSASMSKAELSIQRQGYIAAFRHPDVAAAVAARGEVAVAYLEWSGPDDQRIVMPWTVLSDVADATRFADGIAAAPLTPGFTSPPWRSGTSISRALLFAADMFVSDLTSHVIDMSGNGPNNTGGPLAPVRERIIARGITINGLPIVRPGDNRPGFPLGEYYEDCVIGGPGAFSITVDRATQLAAAIRRKLVMEIAVLPARFTLAGFEPPSASRSDTDCD